MPPTFLHFLRAALAASISLAAVSGCDRSSNPPIAPAQPTPARGPGAPSAPPVVEPPPPPKEAPAEAPASPTAAAPIVEEKPASPTVEEKPDKPVAAAKPRVGVREIRPSEPGKGCIEMYGTCTPPPEKLCTSSAFYLDCGERGQVPNTGEWVHCVCPQ